MIPTDDQTAPPKPFRFKSTSSRSRESRSPPRESRSHHHHHRRHHHSHHRSKRHKTSPAPYEDPALDADTAFRESLFDALADDEGAEYWEGVYGQPIHTYPRPSVHANSGAPHDDTSANENLEAMTDEEYVTYVRAKMWEKSHQHILDERKRREEERIRRKKQEEESRQWEQGVEEALERGEERRRKARWKGRWDAYLKQWESFTRHEDQGDTDKSGIEGVRDRIPWPVLSGLWQDVNPDEVERFYRHAPQAGGNDDEAAMLKLERVRWHPDKVQQKAGFVDKETLGTVTAVFQIVDRVWSKTRTQ